MKQKSQSERRALGDKYASTKSSTGQEYELRRSQRETREREGTESRKGRPKGREEQRRKASERSPRQGARRRADATRRGLREGQRTGQGQRAGGRGDPSGGEPRRGASEGPERARSIDGRKAGKAGGRRRREGREAAGDTAHGGRRRAGPEPPDAERPREPETRRDRSVFSQGKPPRPEGTPMQRTAEARRKKEEHAAPSKAMLTTRAGSEDWRGPQQPLLQRGGRPAGAEEHCRCAEGEAARRPAAPGAARGRRISAAAELHGG